MNRIGRAILTLLVVLGVALAASSAGAQTAAATKQTPPPATKQAPPEAAPAQSAQASQQAQAPGQVKWVNPIRGTVEIVFLKPDVKQVKADVVTTIKVKNVSNGPIARLKVEEFWWDKNNNPVSSNQDWSRKPVMPGEVVTFTMTTPKDGRMFRNNYKFSHANGDVKPKQVPKFEG
jgi:hypothetical protein